MTIATRPVEIAPRGTSRPWYPIIRMRCDASMSEDGQGVVLSIGNGDEIRTERVGLRRWFRHIRHADPKFKDA